ncbi:boron transporter 4-like protein [Tanacetum coccineum]
MATVTIGGNTFEAGASILHPKNYNALNFTKMLGLRVMKDSEREMSLGIWDGGVNHLNLDGFSGILELGGVRDGTQIVLWNWAEDGSGHADMSDRCSDSDTQAYKKVSIIPALMIAGLYFFDHSVASKLAQQKEFNLKNPSAYHYDILLLGFMTLLSGLLGLPPSNGVLPQSPMPTKSLVVLKKQVRPLKNKNTQKFTEDQIWASELSVYLTNSTVSLRFSCNSD